MRRFAERAGRGKPGPIFLECIDSAVKVPAQGQKDLPGCHDPGFEVSRFSIRMRIPLVVFRPDHIMLKVYLRVPVRIRQYTVESIPLVAQPFRSVFSNFLVIEADESIPLDRDVRGSVRKDLLESPGLIMVPVEI